MHIFCLKNKAFIPKAFWTVVTLGSLLLLPAFRSYGQGEFRSDDFQLLVPDSFERAAHKEAILVLRNKTQGFPTFNAVISPEPWPYSKLSAAQQGQKLEDSYHLIGLKNAQLNRSSLGELDGRLALKATLNYGISETGYLSEVWLIPLSDRHLIFTAIFKNPAREEDLLQIEQLVQGIKIKGVKLSEESGDSKTDGGYGLALAVIALLALGVILTWAFLRRRSLD